MKVALRCHQCGNPMSADRRKPCYIHADFKVGDPVFCSTKCAYVYKAGNLTVSKLAGLWAQLQLIPSP